MVCAPNNILDPDIELGGFTPPKPMLPMIPRRRSIVDSSAILVLQGRPCLGSFGVLPFCLLEDRLLQSTLLAPAIGMPKRNDFISANVASTRGFMRRLHGTFPQTCGFYTRFMWNLPPSFYILIMVSQESEHRPMGHNGSPDMRERR